MREGKLLRELLDNKQFTEILGMDVSFRSLEVASERLHLDRLPPMKKERIKLMHGSLMYKDKRLAGYDAACVIEVIEHLDPPRLAAFERVLFEKRPAQAGCGHHAECEYNVKFETLPAGKFRHKDHRFEWTREQFRNWADSINARFGYSAKFLPWGRKTRRLRAYPDGSVHPVKITLPELSLVVLIGRSGCGKSTFARKHFKPTEVLSSDFLPWPCLGQ